MSGRFLFNYVYSCVIRLLISGGWEIFLVFKMSRLPHGPNDPPCQWVLMACSAWLKQPGCEFDQSSPCSAEVNNVWSGTSTYYLCLCDLDRDDVTSFLPFLFHSVVFSAVFFSCLLSLLF